jgi:hypothetical protein
VAKTKFVPYGLYECDDVCTYWIAQLGSVALCYAYRLLLWSFRILL